ncbi:MAG: hypothetical protein U0165_14200 [Polyangiaceae bacterium]
MSLALTLATTGAVLSIACQPTSAKAPVASASASSSAEPSTGWAGRWATFRSKRFGVVLPLPDGPSWKIDDHNTPWLTATHEPTKSSIKLRILLGDEPFTSQRCEDRIRQIEPTLPSRSNKDAVDLGAVDGLSEWDATAFAVIAPHPADKSKTLARYLLTAAHVRKCMVIYVSTEASGPTAGAVLGDRLGDVAQGIVARLKLDAGIETDPPRLPRPPTPSTGTP